MHDGQGEGTGTDKPESTVGSNTGSSAHDLRHIAHFHPARIELLPDGGGTQAEVLNPEQAPRTHMHSHSCFITFMSTSVHLRNVSHCRVMWKGCPFQHHMCSHVVRMQRKMGMHFDVASPVIVRTCHATE